MKKSETGDALRFRPRDAESISISMPKDTLATLKKVAAQRDMSLQALLKLYIGHGLRQDVSRFFGDHVLETAAQVLTKHLRSEREVASIMREIREESVGWPEAFPAGVVKTRAVCERLQPPRVGRGTRRHPSRRKSPARPRPVRSAD